MAWWQEPLRAVTLEFPASDVATIDVKAIVDETARGHVNLLCVFATGYYPGGTAFYPSKTTLAYPGLNGRDLLQETIDAARGHGQKVIAYVASIWGGRDLYVAHPDWAQRKADGEITSWDDDYTSVAMCPNSPYRAHLADIVTEIGDRYDIDGFYFDEPSFQSWCSCRYCREKYAAEHQMELPLKEAWDDPNFQRFLDWRYAEIAAWRQELYDLAKTEDRCVFFQGAFPLACLQREPMALSGIAPRTSFYWQRFGVSWQVPMAHGDDMRRTAAIGDLVHIELYRRSVNEPLWWYGVCLRYVRSIAVDKPCLVLGMMAQSPFDLYGLPEAELRLSVADVLANSGAPLFARYYPDRVDQEAWDRVYGLFAEAEALALFLGSRESVKFAALLYSPSTYRRFDHVDGKPSHLGELKGFAKALLQAHILFDILTEDDLADRLADYEVLILPNASCLSVEAKAAIRSFVAAGGGLVGSYEAALHDETGLPTEDNLGSLFGIAYAPDGQDYQADSYMRMRSDHDLPIAIPAGKRVPTGGLQVKVQAAGASPVADLLGGAVVHYGPLGDEPIQPVALTQRMEKGRAVYLAPSIGVRYLELGVEDHRQLIAAAATWAAGHRPPIRLLNAPRHLAMTAFRQNGRTLVHLVSSVRDEVMSPIAELLPARLVKLEIVLTVEPGDVKLFGDTTSADWTFSDDILTIVISEVTAHVLVVVEET